MAVIVTVEIPGGTQEQYEETTRLLEATDWFPPQGFLAHAAGPDGSGGWRVVDFWDSEDAFLAFVEKARPIFDRGGVRTILPTVQEAVNVILK
ncbi:MULTISPECIES: antibiotic biosynthesis monooxygenase [unclassified Streptomyces]|uniref:antibiotic biosynthesis monooxygenase n=1 Tax=unclassified Streptomyces TaxID=2593676 RepID=UPI001E571606|nr:antibiotic biosynthesis monooxygenase [Streptomyces sp. CB02980]MCB8907282.1 antibiotic biosynthesis monooxygenase [Streptomyces sp. CB02980]